MSAVSESDGNVVVESVERSMGKVVKPTLLPGSALSGTRAPLYMTCTAIFVPVGTLTVLDASIQEDNAEGALVSDTALPEETYTPAEEASVSAPPTVTVFVRVTSLVLSANMSDQKKTVGGV
jgi:hypothetical protein